MADKPTLTLVAQPQAFFKQLISEAIENQKLTTQPETEFYLVNLLNKFMTTDRLYVRDGTGGAKDEPLAIMIKEALEQSGIHQQSALFQRVGDISLYVAGFFQDSLNRKLVDVDYYIDMGGVAYQQVATRVDEAALKSLYLELAQKFGSLVEVLAEVSQKTSGKTEQDILRLYELWVRTRSERAARILQEAGIVPNETIKDTIKKDWQ